MQSRAHSCVVRPLRRRILIGVSLSTILGVTSGVLGAVNPAKSWVYIGTYTGAKSQGIYLFELDSNSGALAARGLAAEASNPSFLALHPNGRVLYSVNEVAAAQGQPGGRVTSFAIDPRTGRLSVLNQESSGGAGPCHLVVDAAGRWVLAANYGGGSVICLPIQADGRLGPKAGFVQHTGSSVNPSRQKEPHAHSINLDRAGRFAFAADLGLDKVLIYRLDATSGTLSPNSTPWAAVKPGAGPRHFAFHPTGRFAYVINEMDCTVTAFSYDSNQGVLQTIDTVSTLPDGVKEGYSTAEVQVHPAGKFLYGSNRGHDSIAVFAIDTTTGKLQRVENEPTQGRTPRNFGIDPSGTFLIAANQNSDSLVVFRIDAATGRLEPTGHTASAPVPVCVKFLGRGL